MTTNPYIKMYLISESDKKLLDARQKDVDKTSRKSLITTHVIDDDEEDDSEMDEMYEKLQNLKDIRISSNNNNNFVLRTATSNFTKSPNVVRQPQSS